MKFCLNSNFLLLFAILHGVQNICCQVELSSLEENCISSTGVSRDAVIQDKNLELVNQERQNNKSPNDSKFNDYLGCYAEKLFESGQLSYTKNVWVQIPGYRTKYEMKSLYCNEEDEKLPLRSCVLKF